MRFSGHIEEKVGTLLSSLASRLGLLIIQVVLSQKNGQSVLCIFLEGEGYRPVKLGECADFSREAAVLLDVYELINFSYTLEVSSPGIERPLVCIEDFQHFVGRAICLFLKASHVLAGQSRRCTGVISAVKDDENGQEVIVDDGKTVHNWPYDVIEKANLLYEDRKKTSAPKGRKKKSRVNRK